MSFLAGIQRTPLIQPLRIFTHYLLPVLAVLTALQTNLWIAPSLGVLPPYLTFVAAVMITAWFGGFLPAVFAIVLSALIINYYFIPPVHSFVMKAADTGTIAFFVLEAVAIAFCIDYLRKNEGVLRRANMDLKHEVTRGRREISKREERLHGVLDQLAATEERERRQLAAELHDHLAQLLTLTRMKMKQAQQSLPRSIRTAEQYIAQSDDLLHKSLDYVRTLMAELYPPQLYELGLADALRWLAGQMPRHGLAVDVSIGQDSVTLVNEKALLLYQSVRELLMNIVKHAAVNRAMVALRTDSDSVVITVQDAGRGFDPSAMQGTVPGRHFGLPSVRDRITTMGGTLVIDSAVGKGTKIVMSVPLRQVSTSTSSTSLRAASAPVQDRVTNQPDGHPDQQSLPL